MAIKLNKKLGDGAFGDVWEGLDDLERLVAVKIIRPAQVGVADAMAHARALARVNHTNIVRVFTISKVMDPVTNTQVDCVVMELLKGLTLAAHLASTKLTLKEVIEIGGSLIDGIEHIHGHGLAHGDLHEENVMLTDGHIKILDILYLDSLAVLGTTKKETRLRRDLVSLRLLLQQIIAHSTLDPAEATEFNSLLPPDATLTDLRNALRKVTSLESTEDSSRKLDHAFARLIDSAFDDSEEYAFALAEKTPGPVTVPLLKRLIAEDVYESRRRRYAQLLWQRLNDEEKKGVLADLTDRLNQFLPNKGKWWPHLQLLSALGPPAWKMLDKIDQLRISGMIINDLLAGSYDIYGPDTSKGALGTYANDFWWGFSEGHLNKMTDNVISLLQQGWYTQNYVGKWHLALLPNLAERTGREDQIVDALYDAYSNDARLIRNGLKSLPDEWSSEILNRHAESRKPATPEVDDSDIPF